MYENETKMLYSYKTKNYTKKLSSANILQNCQTSERKKLKTSET